MKPVPMNTRDDLISLITQVPPTRACATAVRTGRITVLGGFTPPGNFSQWIAMIESDRGKKWFIAIEVDEDQHKFKRRWYEHETDVPWAYWDGHPFGTRPLIDGDIPQDMHRRKFAALLEKDYTDGNTAPATPDTD
jgi:hypothetical protein